jgi:hypothetical protein
MTLYVDGVVAAKGYTQTGPVAWPSDAEPAELIMGAWLGKDNQTFFKGMLDEVRIWSVAKTEEEINMKMHGTLAPPLTPGDGLTMYWRFDRAYCDEINWALSKVAITPAKAEMDLVPRMLSGADVELLSVSWACLAECAPLDAPLWGQVIPSPAITHEGDLAKVVCNSNFALQCDGVLVSAGAPDCSTVSCSNDGENNGVYLPPGPATCLGMCPSYSAVANGAAVPSGSVYVGDAVEITCNKGYVLADGDKSPATCNAAGSVGGAFDKVGAMCIAQCGAYVVEHGVAVPDGDTLQGDIVTITCDGGYGLIESVLSGPAATCVDGGQGSGGVYDKPAAVCRAQCAPLEAVAHGAVSPVGSVWESTIVSISCKSGYYLAAGSYTYATCTDTGSGGDYVFDPANTNHPTCIAVCKAFGSVEHGSVTPSGEVHDGDLVNVQCDNGYEIEGGGASFQATCQDTGLGGDYNKNPPKCVRKVLLISYTHTPVLLICYTHTTTSMYYILYNILYICIRTPGGVSHSPRYRYIYI